MNDENEIRLNIGAGQTYIPGFVNIDMSSKADVSLDLGKDRLPFDDNSVDLVFSYHCLEHIPDYLFVISEIHRVLKHGGRLLVGLPYVTLTEFNLVNPYHLHHFNEFSFDFFDTDKLKGSAVEENPVLFKKISHRFHYLGLFNFVPPPFRTWCRRHLFNVVQKIDFAVIAIKNDSDSSALIDKRILQDEFKECFDARVPYEKSDKHKNKKHTILGKIKRVVGSLAWH